MAVVGEKQMAIDTGTTWDVFVERLVPSTRCVECDPLLSGRLRFIARAWWDAEPANEVGLPRELPGDPPSRPGAPDPFRDTQIPTAA
jgi:hypothetical protein